MSLEVPAFSALLESGNGTEAHPARVDAAVINNVPPRIQADAFSAIGPSELELPYPLATLYAIVSFEVKIVQRRWYPDFNRRKPRNSASRQPVRNTHRPVMAALCRWPPLAPMRTLDPLRPVTIVRFGAAYKRNLLVPHIQMRRSGELGIPVVNPRQSYPTIEMLLR